jgi:hypothetical protein
VVNLDTALRKVGKTILGSFGTDVTMRRVFVGGYDTTTGKPVRTEIEKTIKGRLGEYEQVEIGELIQAGDRKLTIAASDLTFNPSVSEAEKLYRVISVKSPQATDQAALHVLQLRGAS